MAAEDARKVIEKMEAHSSKLEAHKKEQKEKIEKEKARRAALADAALQARKAQQDDVVKKGEEKAMRTSRAAEVRTEKIAKTVQRNQGHLKHALDVFEKKKAEMQNGGGESARSESSTSSEQMLSPHPAATEDKKSAGGTSIAGLGLQLSTPRASADAESGKPKILTPRASPRRQAPELPTIREEICLTSLPGDAVDMSELPNGMRYESHKLPCTLFPVLSCVFHLFHSIPYISRRSVSLFSRLRSCKVTGINETLSAITSAISTTPNVFESRNGKRKATRAFERVCFQKVGASGFGRSQMVYQVVWADGSRRTVSL